MKNQATLVAILALFVLSFAAYAHPATVEGAEQENPLRTVLQKIRETQGIGENERIDPDKVSDGRLEELGEALMGIMHLDPEVHEWMDETMGGEGTETLAAMHRMMGYRYLWRYYGGMAGSGMMCGGWFGGPSPSSGWGRCFDMMYLGH